jgi:hypothetical protein
MAKEPEALLDRWLSTGWSLPRIILNGLSLITLVVTVVVYFGQSHDVPIWSAGLFGALAIYAVPEMIRWRLRFRRLEESLGVMQIPAEHFAKLKSTLGSLRNSAEDGSVSSAYGGSIDRKAFRAHLSWLTPSLDAWDTEVAKRIEAEKLCTERVEREVAARLADPAFQRFRIQSFLSEFTVLWALNRNSDLVFNPTWESKGSDREIGPLGEKYNAWIEVPPTSDETDRQLKERIKGYKELIEKLGNDSLSWPETAAIPKIYDATRPARMAVMAELKKATYQEIIPVNFSCPVCELNFPEAVGVLVRLRGRGRMTGHN